MFKLNASPPLQLYTMGEYNQHLNAASFRNGFPHRMRMKESQRMCMCFCDAFSQRHKSDTLHIKWQPTQVSHIKDVCWFLACWQATLDEKWFFGIHRIHKLLLSQRNRCSSNSYVYMYNIIKIVQAAFRVFIHAIQSQKFTLLKPNTYVKDKGETHYYLSFILYKYNLRMPPPHLEKIYFFLNSNNVKLATIVSNEIQDKKLK